MLKCVKICVLAYVKLTSLGVALTYLGMCLGSYIKYLLIFSLFTYL